MKEKKTDRNYSTPKDNHQRSLLESKKKLDHQKYQYWLKKKLIRFFNQQYIQNIVS
jgi:hypothetical protein